MNVYLGVSLSLICLFLSYFILSKLLLVTVFCVILAGLHFKDDFTLFRYVASHVLSFYLWICDSYYSIVNMYHQSNNTNFSLKKCVENNGMVPNKSRGRLQLGYQSSQHNLNSSYGSDSQILNSTGSWRNSSHFLPSRINVSSRPQSDAKEKLVEMHRPKPNVALEDNSTRTFNFTTSGYSDDSNQIKQTYSVGKESQRSSPCSSTLSPSAKLTNSSCLLDPKLYANVSSPGFCSRLVDRLSETMTHQPKYDSIGSFPIVNLRNNSPKKKIKMPVRVRLAPASNDLVFTNSGNSALSRPSVLGPDDSMKSVLQVLKEISRKRIHSIVDEDSEDNSKRLRITESQYNSGGMLHTSLLQQTIQGKRAREESSPIEDDVKKRRKPLQNNEILSSLSSSMSIKPPHLKTKKRKAPAIDDSINTSPVFGKLMKVQIEVTPPLSSNQPVTHEAKSKCEEKEEPPSELVCEASSRREELAIVKLATPESAEKPLDVVKTPDDDDDDEEDGVVSRLLGRMSDKIEPTCQLEVPSKENKFMLTNDLSLSPPKENRLAAMIAVLGGPGTDLEPLKPENTNQPERIIKGKALFTSPETPATPETPKQNKKVTFCETLTTTKIYDRDQAESENPLVNSSLLSQSTPLSSLNPGLPKNSTLIDKKINSVSDNTSNPKQQLGFNSSPAQCDSVIMNGTPANSNTSATLQSISSPSTPNHPTNLPQTSNFFTPALASTSDSVPLFSNPTNISSNVTSLKATGLSFGSSNSFGGISKETTSDSVPKTISGNQFSFTTGTKTTQLGVTTADISKVFSNSPSQSEPTKPATPESASIAGQGNPNLNFSNRNESSSSTQLVNGYTPATVTSTPFSFTSGTSSTSNKPFLQNFNTNLSTPSQPAPAFNFGSPSFSSASLTTPSTTAQPNTPLQSSTTPNSLVSNGVPTSLPITSTSSQTNSSIVEPVKIFGSAANSSGQMTTQSPFIGGNQNLPAFTSVNPQTAAIFKPVSSSVQTPTQSTSIFGNTTSQTSGFGNTAVSALQNGTSSVQTANLFGTTTLTTTPKSTIFGSVTSGSTQSSNLFGSVVSSTSSQSSSSPFGMSLSNPSTTTSTMFGNIQTPTPTFGTGSSSSSTQSCRQFSLPTTTSNQTNLSGSGSTEISKNIFSSSSTQAPAFGVPNNHSVPAFGNQNNTAPLSFGNKTSTTVAFGNQNNQPPSFGSQGTNLNSSQSGFSSSGGFNVVPVTTSTSETKPTVFSSSPFMFGSTSSTKPSEPVKPFGAATPFMFNSSSQSTSSSTNTAQTSVPAFGAPNTAFGGNQQTSSFGTSTSQTSAPVFPFGQASTAPAPTFPFNAGPPQPVAGGGRFSIGSGSTSRSKPGTLRRRHKPT